MMRLEHPDDPEFSQAFVALEEAIFSGATPPDIADSTSTENQKRLKQAKAVLMLLDFDRRLQAVESPRITLPATFEYSHQTIGGFHIEGELGHGGYGIVYLARDPRLNRYVALKVPRTEALFSPTLRRRFLKEAQSAADLEHPHLTPIYEVGEQGPCCFLVTKYCNHGSLAEYLRKSRGNVPVRSAADLVAKIADAVEYMHRKGLLHRDIKPSNILLEGNDETETGTNLHLDPGCLAGLHPRLSDFGLVKWVGQTAQGASSISLDSQGILGTPAYMAPEQAGNRSGAIGPTADVYSLGATLYELLIGRPPFEGSNVADILQKVLTAEPISPRRERREIPRELENVCLKCLEKDPSQRYKSAGALATDLRRFLAGDPVLGRRPSIVRRAWHRAKRKPLVPVAAALTVGLICSVMCFAALLAWRDRLDARRIKQAEYLRLIRQADDGLRTGKRAGINELLNKLRPVNGEDDFRGFEWYYLWQEMWNQGPIWSTGRDGSFCFSNDGRFLACAGMHSYSLWDVGIGKRLRSFSAPEDNLSKLRFSTSGRYVALVTRGDPNGTVRILTGGLDQEVWSKQWKNIPAHAVRVARDDRTIVVVDQNQISICDLNDHFAGDCFYKPEPSLRILCGGISHDASIIAALTSGMELRWWDRISNRLLGSRSISGPLKPRVTVSPDGQFLAFSSQKEISVITSQGGRLVARLSVDRDDDLEMEFSRDNRLLMTVSATGNIKANGETTVWDLGTGKPLLTLPDENVLNATLSPTDSAMAIETRLGSQPVIQIVRFAARIPPSILNGNHGEAWGVAFAPDNRSLASSGDDGNVRLWNLASGRQTRFLPHGQLVAAIVYSPDGKTLATGSDDNKVRFWDPASGKLLSDFAALSQPARFLAFSPDGRFLAVGERSKTAVVLDCQNTTEVLRITTPGELVKGLAFSPDSATLYCGDDNGYLSFWSLRERKMAQQLSTHSLIRRINASPKGKLLATAHADGSIALRDAITGADLQILRGHQEEVLALTFDREGRTLASAGSDHSVILWRCIDGQKLLQLNGPTLQINDLAFSPDGKTLAAACHDGKVYLWRGASTDAEPPPYEPLTPAPTGNLDYSKHHDILLPSSPVCIGKGYLENDGHEKLVVLCSESSGLFEVAPNHPGGLIPLRSQLLPTNPPSFALADFNKNGQIDLAIANPVRKGIDVHWSVENKQFGRLASFHDNEVHGALFPYDINNDGQLDLLAVNPLTDSVSVYISRRYDRLDPIARCPTGRGPCHVSVADLNNDGKSDLIVTEHSDNAISVHLGKGDGAFHSRTTLGDLDRPRATAIGDFNNDGKPDIAVVQENGVSVVVFLNNGTGGLEARKELPVGKGCRDIIAEDLDGDGFIDLAVVNPTDSTISVLYGKGNGEFLPAKQFPTGTGPTSLLATVPNEDGIRNLVVCCQKGKCIVIHRGTQKQVKGN